MKRLASIFLVCLFVAACGGVAKPSPTSHPRVAPLLLVGVTFRPHTVGAPVIGEVLTTTNGTWTNDPTSFTYQWQRCSTSCSNIVGATGPTYTIQSADVGDTIDVVVTATNAGGSASQTSTASGVVVGGGGNLTCNFTASTVSALNSDITSATPGQAVCLSTGDYSGWTGATASKPSCCVTITAAPGATATFNSGINMSGASPSNLSTIQNFTMDGTAGGGTISVGGDLDMETSGDASQTKALNITVQNVTFNASSPSVIVQGPHNSNITFNRDVFIAGNIQCPPGLGGTVYDLSSGSTPSGLTIENSVFVAPMDEWNPDRAVQDTNPMVFENNVVTGFVDHTEGASCNHIDGLQWYSGTNGTGGSTSMVGNLCYDDYGCGMAFDGTEDNTITDNVCFDTETGCFSMYSDSPGSLISHNVEEQGGADPGGCNSLDDPSAPIQSCGSGTMLVQSHKSGDRASSGETVTNNIGKIAADDPIATNSNNLFVGAVSPNINGSPTYVGGTNPTTWAGFQLTPASAGHAAGSDGLDVGVRASEGGPPTGGGSTPVNNVAPVLSGTATHGDPLSVTNGAWTITGNVPTAITYQWFDCPTSTYAIASCPAIEPQTAPASTNGPTYTLASTDVGDYVFAEVTVTNANGQVNALSNAVGPIG